MLDPVLQFFLLGLAAGLLRSELRLLAAVYDPLVSMLLLAPTPVAKVVVGRLRLKPGAKP